MLNEPYFLKNYNIVNMTSVDWRVSFFFLQSHTLVNIQTDS